MTVLVQARGRPSAMLLAAQLSGLLIYPSIDRSRPNSCLSQLMLAPNR
jgi:hypothetical protein